MSAPQATAVSVWKAGQTRDMERSDLTGVTEIRAGGALVPVDGEPRDAGVTIQPIDPRDGVIAVVLVSVASSASLVAVNGNLAPSGLHLLRHADRLDVAGRPFWFSAESAPVRTPYISSRHGPEVRCGLTKARLRAGQEIVICPGVPGTPCGVIYKASAWDAVIQANPQMKCMNCGFRPGQTAWRPPAPKPPKEILDGLRQLTARR